jgi:uncharacterized protein HemY
MGLGLLAYRDGDFTTSADFFSRTVAVDPSDFDYLLLTSALKQAGRPAEAKAAEEQAHRVSADWAQAQQKARWFIDN